MLNCVSLIHMFLAMFCDQTLVNACSEGLLHSMYMESTRTPWGVGRTGGGVHVESLGLLVLDFGESPDSILYYIIQS